MDHTLKCRPLRRVGADLAHPGIGHSVPPRASSCYRTSEIHPAVVHTDAITSVTTKQKRRECVKPLSVRTVGDLVNITRIHSSSLDCDRGRNNMEVFLSELARKEYTPRLNDCATRPSSNPATKCCGHARKHKVVKIPTGLCDTDDLHCWADTGGDRQRASATGGMCFPVVPWSASSNQPGIDERGSVVSTNNLTC